jgi:nucleotide-binding universal stress UspA family protein
MMSPFNRILLCYDATPEGRTALRCGAMLAKQLLAGTHLLAIPDCSYWTLGFDVLSAISFDLDEQVAREILQEGVDKLREWDVNATGHFATGNPIDQIPRLANSLKVDLIVIGHHPEGFFARWWTGENHALLLDRVSCGVLFEVT